MENISKNNNYKNLEVLSPAGGSESFFAGIKTHANAIYLGLSSFNARMKAENFTAENIREYTKIAHLFGVKIYVTINTLILDEDFDNLISLVKKCVEAKVDAFIIQDLGVAHVLKSCFPNICLHASTQMGIHNLEGAKIAEKLGFSRVVLSRETKLEDIKKIHDNTNLEIEYFVQGALCVAFSGNCYLSSIENGASGNEGKCLQLCRLPCKNNLTGEEKYYLSTRDLCLMRNLKTLIDAGVTSFKIEGRLRHAGYVATATKAYSEAIKKIENGNFDNNFISNQKQHLTESFSRGDYNENAYLDRGTPDSIIFPDFQNHIGRKIGKVLSVKPFKQDLFKVQIESSHDLSAGDGLKIIDTKSKKQLASLGVGNVSKIKNNVFEIVTKNKFAAGNDVYLTQNANYEQNLLKNSKKIKINAKIIANKNEKLQVILESNGSFICHSSEIALEEAKNKPLALADFESQFNKLGDTPFVLSKLDVQTNGVFVPKSLLNEIRRESIKKLQDQIVLDNEKHLSVSFDENKYLSIKNAKIQLISKDLYIIDENYTNFDEKLTYVFAPNYYNLTVAEKYNEISSKYNVVLSVPTILSNENMQVFRDFISKLQSKPTLFANNIGALEFSLEGYNIITSPLINVKNNYALKCLNSLGIEFICASIEAPKSFITKNNLTAFASGNFPLMTFAHCPYKSVFGGTCKECKYNGKLAYQTSKGEYKISRTKLASCTFSLNKPLSQDISGFKLINLKNI